MMLSTPWARTKGPHSKLWIQVCWCRVWGLGFRLFGFWCGAGVGRASSLDGLGLSKGFSGVKDLPEWAFNSCLKGALRGSLLSQVCSKPKF